MQRNSSAVKMVQPSRKKPKAVMAGDQLELQGRGESHPERAVGTERGRAERVAGLELPHPGQELGQAAVEEGEADDDVVTSPVNSLALAALRTNVVSAKALRPSGAGLAMAAGRRRDRTVRKCFEA